MVSNLFSLQKLKQSSNFGVKHYKDSYYIGEIDPDTGVRQGLGICVYNSQRVYEGNWDDDKREGKGFERFSNGNYYEGNFEKGRVSGKGIYTWYHGEVYDGEWLNG